LTSPKFAQSPLITPARVRTELGRVFAAAPRWALVEVVDHDPNRVFEENVCAVAAGTKAKRIVYRVNPLIVAALFEITRFGNSVVTNANRPQDDPKGKPYLRATFAGAAEDHVTVGRLVINAGPHEEAVMAEAVTERATTELRVEYLGKTSSGSAVKSARPTAVEHAEAAARKHAPPDFNITAYVGNIWALFAEHDMRFDLPELTTAQ